MNENTKPTWSKFLLLDMASVALCATTVVLGAAPLLAKRSVYGRTKFWSGLTLVSALLFLFGLTPLATTFLSLGILVGIYFELESIGMSQTNAGLVTILFTSGLTVLGTSLLVNIKNINFATFARQHVATFADRFSQINGTFKIDADAIITQIPSGLAIVLIISLALAITMEKLVGKLIGLNPLERTAHSLYELRLPDVCLWLVIFSGAGVLLKYDLPLVRAISLNVLNAMIVLYFFQGLAIVFSFFKIYRVSSLWRSIWLFLMIFQLFLFVSLVGIVDFWFDLRKRMVNKMTATKLDKRV